LLLKHLDADPTAGELEGYPTAVIPFVVPPPDCRNSRFFVPDEW
jgi:hypothetical protein